MGIYDFAIFSHLLLFAFLVSTLLGLWIGSGLGFDGDQSIDVRILGFRTRALAMVALDFCLVLTMLSGVLMVYLYEQNIWLLLFNLLMLLGLFVVLYLDGLPILNGLSFSPVLPWIDLPAAMVARLQWGLRAAIAALLFLFAGLGLFGIGIFGADWRAWKALIMALCVAASIGPALVTLRVDDVLMMGPATLDGLEGKNSGRLLDMSAIAALALLMVAGAWLGNFQPSL